MEFAEHGTVPAPYVVRSLRRYILGPDTAGAIKVKVLLDEAATVQDSAPRPVELDPDSAAAKAVADSARRGADAVKPVALDRQLLIVSACLMAFGLLTLYSAGQTDVPTRAAGVWYRQFFWFGIGVVAGWVVFHVSMRLLEWLAPAFYGGSLLLLLVVLAVGTGAGTAESSHSWLSIGGHQIGQPSELAKVATVLMLARYLSGRKEPPRALRDLLLPGLIVGVPFLLVLKQPDLGSAIVFIGIAFAMLFWAGVRPRLLFLIASPGLSLLLAFNNWAWGAWMVAVTTLLVVWRPYIYDSLVVWFLNVAMGTIALPLWSRLAPYQQNRLLTFLNPEADPAPPAITPSNRVSPSDRVAGSAPATRRAPRSGWPFYPSSTPTSSFRLWARSWASWGWSWRSRSS